MPDLASDHKTITSEFESRSICETLDRIGAPNAPLYLPAIQRHFVWGMEKIPPLFDSIMRGYPIGTFLFWEVDDQSRGDYSFYEFIRDFNEHPDHCNNRTAPRSLPKGLTGVLDGQQRLNSMYVALRGSYAEFIGGKGNPRSSLDSYPRLEFYLNVYFVPTEEDGAHYQFRFLADWERHPSRFDEQHYWFPVTEIYHCSCKDDVLLAWNAFSGKQPPHRLPTEAQTDKAVSILDLLRQRLRDEKLITYFPIRNRDLSEALQIFIRANNGGTHVREAELIFSTIIAHWNEGRTKIEEITHSLTKLGNGFYQFEYLHTMLACLALSGCPIRMRIESFKPAHVELIKESWEGITSTLRRALGLADEWNLSGNHKIRPQSFIAIAIFIQAGIDVTASKADLRLFFLRSLLCDLYKRPEQALHYIREYARSYLKPGAVFDLKHFEETFELPSEKGLGISPEEFESLLTLHFWDHRTYILLTLLHPQHAVHQHAFEKDHIHPQSRFALIGEFNLTPEQEGQWHLWKNQLPNLQLLQAVANNDKSAKPFKEWLELYRPHRDAQRSYLAENDIPEDISLDFSDFEMFFQARKERLRERLAVLLHMPTITHTK